MSSDPAKPVRVYPQEHTSVSVYIYEYLTSVYIYIDVDACTQKKRNHQMLKIDFVTT